MRSKLPYLTYNDLEIGNKCIFSISKHVIMVEEEKQGVLTVIEGVDTVIGEVVNCRREVGSSDKSVIWWYITVKTDMGTFTLLGKAFSDTAEKDFKHLFGIRYIS